LKGLQENQDQRWKWRNYQPFNTRTK